MDWLRNKYGMTKWTQRFLSQFIHLVISPSLLVICMFFGEDQKWLVFSLLVLATGLLGFQTSGYAVGFLDLFPRFSPLMNTLGNTLGAGAGILGPVIASNSWYPSRGQRGGTSSSSCCRASFLGIIIWYKFAKVDVDDLLNTPIIVDEVSKLS